MKMSRLSTGLFALVACCGLAAAQDSGNAGGQKNAQPPMDAEAAAQWEAWEKTNQVTEQHARLATDMVGKWKTVTTFWMAPGGEGMKSEGTSNFAPVLDGRFIMSEFSGNMMGMPFKGIGYFGYNTLTSKFESLWMDSASNLMMMTTGDRGADGAITWSGAYPDPMTGQVKQYKAVSRFPEKGKMVYEMYDTTTDGREFKSLEVVYTRIGSGGPVTIDASPVDTGRNRVAPTPADPSKTEPKQPK